MIKFNRQVWTLPHMGDKCGEGSDLRGLLGGYIGDKHLVVELPGRGGAAVAHGHALGGRQVLLAAQGVRVEQEEEGRGADGAKQWAHLRGRRVQGDRATHR